MLVLGHLLGCSYQKLFADDYRKVLTIIWSVFVGIEVLNKYVLVLSLDEYPGAYVISLASASASAFDAWTKKLTLVILLKPFQIEVSYVYILWLDVSHGAMFFLPCDLDLGNLIFF